MVVVWSEQAINDLKSYAKNSAIITESKVQQYIDDLVDYGNSLSLSPQLGKSFLIYKNIQIRQLIYKMHRIFYYIENNEIIIIQIVHTKRNINVVIEIMKKYLN